MFFKGWGGGWEVQQELKFLKLVFVFLFCFFETSSQRSPGCFGTSAVDQADFGHTTVSASLVLGLNKCSTTAWLAVRFGFFFFFKSAWPTAVGEAPPQPPPPPPSFVGHRFSEICTSCSCPKSPTRLNFYRTQNRQSGWSSCYRSGKSFDCFHPSDLELARRIHCF